MAFIETPRFPDNISEGSSGGPRWRTEIVVTQSGQEQRNAGWENARHEYDVAYGVKDISHLESLTDFFMNTRGMLHSFRYKDWADYKSGAVENDPTGLDQQIGVGDAVETQFQLKKTYKIAGIDYERDIKKPVTGTVIVYVDGNPVTPSDIDYTTGIVTLTTPPGAGAIVTAGFEFDVPCRFNTDTLQTQLEVYNVGAAQMPLVEVRL